MCHLPPREAKKGGEKKPHEDIKIRNWNVYKLLGEFVLNSHIPIYY